MSAHVEAMIAELHAARSALQHANLALNRALHEGEPLSPRHVRLIMIEMCGAGEEANVMVARLSKPVPPQRCADPTR